MITSASLDSLKVEQAQLQTKIQAAANQIEVLKGQILTASLRANLLASVIEAAERLLNS
jgi:hypothetical protein